MKELTDRTIQKLCSYSVIILILFVDLSVEKKKNFDADQDVIYELYTRDRPINYQTLEPAAGDTIRTDTTYDPKKPTRIFVHGFLSKRRNFQRYAEAYLKNGDYNFIAVNWIAGSSTYNYIKARGRVDGIGVAIANFIDYLCAHGMNISDLIVVGHSLGAHAAGIAGKNVHCGRIPIIVGLDPAQPLFSKSNTDRRLDSTDADYVQVIHTTGGTISISYPCGHADFYPNGGTDQPGCDDKILGFVDKCSHGRAHTLFLESLNPLAKFVGIQCESYNEIQHGNCTQCGPDALMGGDRDQLLKARGIYYLETSADTPYALSQYNKIKIKFLAI